MRVAPRRRSVRTMRPTERVTRRRVRRTLAGERLAGRVLELGGGPGVTAAALLQVFPTIELTVADSDPAEVARARQRLASTRAVAEVADANRLPHPDGSFDAVACFDMLHHAMTWEQALDEVARVLRRGGRFVGHDLTATRPNELVHRVDGRPYRLYDTGELSRELEARFTHVLVSPAWHGQVVRFRATRT